MEFSINENLNNENHSNHSMSPCTDSWVIRKILPNNSPNSSGDVYRSRQKHVNTENSIKPSNCFQICDWKVYLPPQKEKKKGAEMF